MSNTTAGTYIMPFVTTPLIQDGDGNGTVFVVNNNLFPTSCKLNISDNQGNHLEAIVINKIGINGLQLRKTNTLSYGSTDVSMFTVAHNSIISAPEQAVFGTPELIGGKSSFDNVSAQAINVSTSDGAYLTQMQQENTRLTFRDINNNLLAYLDNLGNWVPSAGGGGGGGGTPGDPVFDSFVSDPAVAVNALVYIDGTGMVKLAKADSTATVPAIGIVTSKPNATTAVVQFNGDIGTAFAGLTVGAPYYLSAITAGSITAIAPANTGSIVQIIGIAKDANTLYLDLDPSVTIL